MKGKNEKRGEEGKRKEVDWKKDRNDKAVWKRYWSLGRKG
jgi:hypothetical protein